MTTINTKCNATSTTPIHWFVRVNDGKNFINSSSENVWGCKNKKTNSHVTKFLRNVKYGDIMWFIMKRSNGTNKIMACSTYLNHNAREIGPLISITGDNEERGWKNNVNCPTCDWDTDIHYKDLYDLRNIHKPLEMVLTGQHGYHEYKSEKHNLDLPNIYVNMIQFVHPVSKL